MHELSISENILNITLEHAKQEKASKVLHIHLVIGQLSSIIDESVQFYWDIISKDTIAEEAILHFRRLPIILSCTLCKKDYTPDSNDLACPYCHKERVVVIQGEEFFLEAIDIERTNI